MVFRNYH